MKKLFFILFGFCAFLNYSFAQDERVASAIKEADYIFKGKVLEARYIKTINKVHYVSYKMLREEVYWDKKKELVDTIELVTTLPFGWNVQDKGIWRWDSYENTYPNNRGIGLDIGMSIIVFAKKNDTDISENYTTISLRPVSDYDDAYFFQYKKRKIDQENQKWEYILNIKGFGKHFYDTTEFQNYLKSYGLDITKEYGKKKDVSSEEKIKDEVYNKRVLKHKEYLDYISLRLKNIDSISSKTETIELTIQNQKISCLEENGKKYFEFDIYAKGNSNNTYLDNLAFVVQYNTNAFHTNISYNNTVQISRADDFNNSTYDNPMDGLIDDTQNSIRFRLGTAYNASSWNRTLITTSSIKLLHIKIELLECSNYSSDLEFIDINNISNVALYTTNPSINPVSAPYLAYMPNYISPNSYNLCSTLKIDDFYPKTISAGTNSILTIIGEGFGCMRGNSDVLFKNSIDGGATYIENLNTSDYLTWSDNEIKIIVPSIVDTNSFVYYPGSGFFTIVTDDEAVFSPDSLTISYSVKNHYNKNPNINLPLLKKTPYRQVSFDDYSNNRAREFSLDTSIVNNPSMSKIVFKALKDWSCRTKINWTIVDTVAMDTVPYGSKSIIFLDDTLVKHKGYTIPVQLNYCTNTNVTPNEDFIFAKAILMGFSRNTSWFYDTTMTQNIPINKNDFYNVILHELGHAHYLLHVNDANDLMYYATYSSSANPVPSSMRNHINSSPNQIEGGLYILDKSYNLSFNCNRIHNTTPLYLTGCGSMSTEQISNNQFQMIVYPNPFNDDFTIEYTLNTPMEIECVITDISGRIIKTTSFKNTTSGTNTNYLSLANYGSGIYFISLSSKNGILVSSKIFKQ